MNTITIQAAPSVPAAPWRRIGIAFSALATLFLLADASATLLAIPRVLAAAATIGFPATPGLWHVLGTVLLLATVLYAIPRTAFVGAIIVTGYLGGAICTHVRVGEDVLAPTLVCLTVATLTWGGLAMRNGRFRAIILGPTEP